MSVSATARPLTLARVGRERMRQAARLVFSFVLAGIAVLGYGREDSASAPSTNVATALASRARPSQALSRPKARQLLEQRGAFPKTAGTNTFAIGDGVWCQSPPKLYGQLQNYVDRGLVTVTPGRASVGDNRCRDARGFHFDVELSPVGKKYLLGVNSRLVDVQTCVEELGEVTGVASEADGMTATVEYSVMKHPTPFGDGRCDGTRTESARFRRYDDGWRIER